MTRLDHLNLTVKNFAETRDWYARVFGFECVEEGQWRGLPWGVLKSAHSMLCIYESPQLNPADEGVFDRYHQIHHFALAVQDRRKWEATLKREKLKITFGGPIDYPHSTSWYIEDPSGYEIEVVCWNDYQPRFG